MYDLNDTIVAVSSPSNDHRVIVRISGPSVIEILNQVFTPAVFGVPGITCGKILNLDCVVYVFRRPHSYTGDDVAEIHVWANAAITEHLLEQLLALDARTAAPGEFTARAYFNNKIDLAQAEAVNEVITASNTFQLSAAENLLAGQFGQQIEQISSIILDLLSRLEAGLDFSTEDIEPTDECEITAALTETIGQLRDLLAGSVRCESTIDLPAVGIAGSPNAGKSTLLNKLLGRQRSIVSEKCKTTRDVLTGELTIHDCRCVLFDCAGLITNPENIIEELARQAAIGALQNATVIIFCVDITKANLTEDLDAWNLFSCHCERSEAISVIPLATKCDLLSQKSIDEKISKLNSLFGPVRRSASEVGCDFQPISSHTGFGLDELKSQITDRLISTQDAARETQHALALTARHRQAITAAIADLEKAVDELKADNGEVAAMMLRTAHNQLNQIEQYNLDEQVLDRIFARFCIGK